MSKQRPSEAKPRNEPSGRKSAGREEPSPPSLFSLGYWLPRWGSPAAIRETVESVIVAFVLAFLFRTFEAEAFVIPTGSMAPTLMGRHKDLYCPKCGYEYQVSASSEVDVNGAAKGLAVESGTCPMCRYTADLGPDNPQRKTYISYNGDRILVCKFSYQIEEPKRWDVIVFKFPGDATTNFIKRLVGLPGETIRISHGDLWVSHNGDAGPFEIARKESPAKLLAMLQPVFDNDLAPRITALGLPARWRPQPSSGEGKGDWTSADGAAFASDGAAAETWLRYEHRIASYQNWQEIVAGGLQNEVPRQLISDFCAYNTGREAKPPVGVKQLGAPPEAESLGLHWVGDLAVQCTAEVESSNGQVVFELVRGGRRFQCKLDVASGKAVLGISGPGDQAEQYKPTATTPMHGPGKYKIVFANVDDQLRLLVNGKEIGFDAATIYDSASLDVRIPREADLSPVAVAARNAAVKISHLKVLRDIYYIAASEARRRPSDFRFQFPDLADPTAALPHLCDARVWPSLFGDGNMNAVSFALAPPSQDHPERDQFLVLGDNSAQSKDSRLWENDGIEHFVSRELLIGKALFIYWPHSWDELPGVPIPFPFFPNFGRMHLVR